MAERLGFDAHTLREGYNSAEHNRSITAPTYQKRLVFLIMIMVLFLVTQSAMAAGKTPVEDDNGFVAKIPLMEWTAVAAQKGWLQEEFAKFGAKTELVDEGAVSSAKNGVEASLLYTGGLHFASRMQYPALLHRINGLDAVVIWEASRVSPRQNVLLVLKDSPINSLQDLKGKNLGSWRVSCMYFSAYEMLKKGSVPLDTDLKHGQVHFVSVQGKAGVQALLAHRIDVLSAHPSVPFISALYSQGLVKEIAQNDPKGAYVAGGGRVSFFVIRSFAEQHPLLVRAFLQTRERTVPWIVAHPDEASEIIARQLRETRDVAKFDIVDSSSYAYLAGEPSADKIMKSIASFQKWAIDNGDDFLINKHLSDAEVTQFVDRRFFKGGQYSIYK
jgi:sulfonate transport system substrate-binding protein